MSEYFEPKIGHLYNINGRKCMCCEDCGDNIYLFTSIENFGNISYSDTGGYIRSRPTISHISTISSWFSALKPYIADSDDYENEPVLLYSDEFSYNYAQIALAIAASKDESGNGYTYTADIHYKNDYYGSYAASIDVIDTNGSIDRCSIEDDEDNCAVAPSVYLDVSLIDENNDIIQSIQKENHIDLVLPILYNRILSDINYFIDRIKCATKNNDYIKNTKLIDLSEFKQLFIQKDDFNIIIGKFIDYTINDLSIKVNLLLNHTSDGYYLSIIDNSSKCIRKSNNFDIYNIIDTYSDFIMDDCSIIDDYIIDNIIDNIKDINNKIKLKEYREKINNIIDKNILYKLEESNQFGIYDDIDDFLFDLDLSDVNTELEISFKYSSIKLIRDIQDSDIIIQCILEIGLSDTDTLTRKLTLKNQEDFNNMLFQLLNLLNDNYSIFSKEYEELQDIINK